MSDIKTGRRTFLKGAASASALMAAESAIAATKPAVDRLAQNHAIPMRPLGNTGVEVPIIHLGTSQRLDPVYDKVMHRCFKSGCYWFDTALSYGWGASHDAIKTFIGQIGDRRKLWLTSKSGSGSPGGLLSSADDALDELGTDYLDLFLMHGIRNPNMLNREYLEVGEKLKQSGKSRFFGFSCHDGNVVELLNKAAKTGGIDAILFRYNFRRYGDLELNRAIDACHKAGIGMLAMKTMGSVPSDLETVVDFRSENFTLGQAKLKSVFADERIASVVSEMDNVQRVRENIKAATTEKSLTAEETHQLNRLAALTANYACNGCSHLCEKAAGGGAQIASQLRFLMYHECYDGKSQRAKELYAELPHEACNLSAERLNAASKVCPQGIDIAARLERAKQVLA